MKNDASKAFDPLSVYSTQRAAELCDVSHSTIARAIRNGQLAAITLDRGKLPGYRIRAADLYDWQERGMPSGYAPARTGNDPLHVDPLVA